MTGKEHYAGQVQQSATLFSRAMETCETMARVFVSRGHESGGADELEEADLVGMENPPSVADVQAFATIMADLQGWLGTGGRRQALDRLRLIQGL